MLASLTFHVYIVLSRYRNHHLRVGRWCGGGSFSRADTAVLIYGGRWGSRVRGMSGVGERVMREVRVTLGGEYPWRLVFAQSTTRRDPYSPSWYESPDLPSPPDNVLQPENQHAITEKRIR